MKKVDLDFFLGVDEIELTDELINKLVHEKKWPDVESLKKLALQGWKWNIKRNSIVIPVR
jgi:hypothetical protein